MSQTFSTLQRELTRGRMFSSRMPAAAPPSPRPAAQQPAAQQPAVAAAQPSAQPGYHFRFTLSGDGLPAAAQLAQGAAATVSIQGQPGSPPAVTGSLTGLRPLGDPAITPTLWLIHDLIVPFDLAPADMAQVARGPSGMGNLPGAIFTVDGLSPTYGAQSNTLSIAVSPGGFTQAADGSWQLSGRLDSAANQAFHPLAVLGPSALGDIDAPLPSGTVADILTDLFMRPATVHPELPLKTHYPQRLAAVVRRRLGLGEGRFLAPEQFTRAAVTLEGLVRATPRLMPNRESCFLSALQRVNG